VFVSRESMHKRRWGVDPATLKLTTIIHTCESDASAQDAVVKYHKASTHTSILSKDGSNWTSLNRAFSIEATYSVIIAFRQQLTIYKIDLSANYLVQMANHFCNTISLNKTIRPISHPWVLSTFRISREKGHSTYSHS
jgi:hypothetical protein